jgi:hypothetical protein
MSHFKLKLILRIFTALLLVGFMFVSPVLADERILSYHSDIKIHQDGRLTVSETIVVRAEGTNIKRGIYRDFPTSYKDNQGNHYRVEFQILSVTRNGVSEPFFTQDQSNGIRTYIGNTQQNLANGEHEYRLVYRTSRQMGFFEEYDELYWNVTGNDWKFPIDRASAKIELPEAVAWAELRNDYYTGAQGSSGKDAEFRVISAREMEFRSTRGLGPQQGLTIALGFPKGIVHEPTLFERVMYFLSDNGSTVALLIGLILPLFWYLRSWHNYGRDPEKGVIIPRFKPPDGLSAAACRYVKDMGMHTKAFTAAIVSLGVKGYLKIDDKDDYTLYREKGPNTSTATPGEITVLTELLPEEESWIELDNENYHEFLGARSGLKAALKAEYHGHMFKWNSIYMLPSLIISVLAVVFAISRSGGPLPWIIFIILTIVMHMVFLFLLRAPTPAGRKVMDEIEGFRMYLSTAEQDRLNRMRSPELTPEVFEMFLPYAFALGVENGWCERFEREFPHDVSADGAYHPAWYSGNHGFQHIGNGLSGSFTSAISSASTPPGSSSGSSGGGFSGGGGGGGGGGGW